MIDYKHEARRLIQNLGQRMDPSPYDIAWLARLKTSANGEARWPELIEWLLDHQQADGSWGGTVIYYHHRIICTLSAMIALQQNNGRHRAPAAVERAEGYLWHHLHLLQRDPFELVGFELLLPTLLQEAQALGLDVPMHTCGYGEIQTAKLRLIPPELLYSPRITTIHSLEFLGRAGDPDRMQAAIGGNGSLGSSPAATAYYLSLYPDDERAWAYLNTVRQRCRQIVCLYPFRSFELTWALVHLSYCGRPVTEFAGPDIWQGLLSSVTSSGIALDPAFGIADADCTSVGAQLLLKAGYDFDPLILTRFQDKKTRLFHTYDYERNISMGVNAHVLDALRLMPDYPDRYQVHEEILFALLANRVYDTYWIDKWHASPYYATAHVVMALLQEGSYLVHAYIHSIDWLLHTQRDDGSWGFFADGTAEETAYAMLALLHWHQHRHLTNVDVFHRAAEYLARAYPNPDATYPGLYIGKVLFAPYDVVRAAILSALILYAEIFNR
jgi:halimadienyl-diphosphate synthase